MTTVSLAGLYCTSMLSLTNQKCWIALMKIVLSGIVKERKFCFLFIIFFVSYLSGYAQSGDQLYKTYCMNCHGDKMQGTTIGSALIKSTWKYGGDRKSISKSISEGIPGTTMISWGSALSAKDLEALTSFILKAQKSPVITKKVTKPLIKQTTKH